MPTITYVPSLPWLKRSKDALYGQCLAGVLDLEGGMSAGRLAHAQELARRSITARGTNIVDRDYGYDIAVHLNGRVRAADLSEAAAELTTQFRADDRTVDAQVSVSYLGGVLIIAATITDGDGPFPLTMSVSEAAVTLLKAGT
jgi:hypothetical protein